MTVSRAWSSLSAPDRMVMRRVNRWMAPAWVRWWIIGATRCGDGWFWLACGLVLLLLHDTAHYAALIASALSAAAGIVLFRTLKNAVGRKRPCAIEPHCWAKLLPPDQFSFPSGHTITAFAVAVPLGYFYPPAEPALLFIACNIAMSRILLGMHFLTDVIAGAIVGAGLGYAAVWVVNGF